MQISNDETWMREAIAEAKRAAVEGEIPIAAIGVVRGEEVGRARNCREIDHNPLGHAELLLISHIARELKNWRLEELSLYVTCEPCLMCAGAILQARIPRVIFGCADPKAGAMGSLYDLSQDSRLNHRVEVIRGVCAAECGMLLSNFFRDLRVGYGKR